MIRDSQATFERVVKQAEYTLKDLARPQVLSKLPKRHILIWISELEELTRTLYQHLNERDGR